MTGRYLDLLSVQELLTLGTASGLPSGDNPVELFRGHPLLVAEALSRQTTLDRLTEADAPVAGVSSRLRVAALVSRLATDLTRSGYVAQRQGASVLVDDGPEPGLIAVVATNRFRIDVTELLFSYLRPGRDDDDIVVMPTAHPDRVTAALHSHAVAPLVHLLNECPIGEHAGILRRLGDLASFTIGVFPDHGDAAIVNRQLLELVSRTLPERLRSEFVSATPAELFGADTVTAMLTELGPIWYRLAAKRVDWPMLAEPLRNMADTFDSTTHFLRLLTSSYLTESRDDLFDFSLI